MSKIGDKIFKDSEITSLMNVIDKMDEATRKEVLRAIGTKMTQAGKTESINKIKQIIASGDKQIKEWIAQAIPNSYILGLEETDKQLKKKTAGITIDDLKTLKDLSVHATAVNAIMSDTYLDFANGMNGLVRGAERQINEAVKQQARASIAGNVLTGMDIRKAKKDIIQIIGDQGFSVLTDRGGHTWTLKRYSEMLSRTHTIRAYNEATINRAIQFEVDLVQISTHSGSCPICVPYQGRIYSLSGASSKYPRYDISLPIHPNCTHNLLMRPDLQQEEDYQE